MNVSACLLADHFLLKHNKSFHNTLQMQNRSCTVASGIKTLDHVLHAQAISTAEDRLRIIMDDQRESLASICGFQDCGGRIGV
ncbi:hypothetical protein CgunFtcFv8_025768 [Champsocephalus gunnari]|uniref:Uncharacterized protein n=1 Tax=Champsocephalus gunnari TaxID=52237 RepID=A0AAN8CC82_CHAGU|nr:hypothetical protein CgunFtcFv8_025768 [Champsocephalus gunnari]